MCEVPRETLVNNSNYNLELFDDMTIEKISKGNGSISHHYFKNYISIPHILKYFNDKASDNKYLDIINRVNQKLNENQKRLLNEKYQPVAFNDLDNVDLEYPFFAYRNIYLNELGLLSYDR